MQSHTFSRSFCSAASGLMAAFLPSVIDYCSFGNHSCNHECVSVLNGYHCTCNEGYRLLDDGKTCHGKSCTLNSLLMFLLWIRFYNHVLLELNFMEPLTHMHDSRRII